MFKNSSIKSSSLNTTESGMWENERKVSEAKYSNLPSPKSPTSPAAAAMSPSKNDSTTTKNYLPQFIVRRFGDEIPILTDSCQLKSKFRGKNGIIHHRYTVSWIEDGPIHQEIDRQILKSKNAVKETINNNNNENVLGKEEAYSKIGDCSKVSKSAPRKCCSVSTKKLSRPKKSKKAKNSKVKKDLSATTLKSEHSLTSQSREVLVELGNTKDELEVRKCDGPCAQMRSITDLQILGRCEHAICSFCVINAPMVSSDDGSMGCCNKRCFAVDLVNQIPDAKHRHEFYQQIFNNQKFEEIFKLYKGDVRRAGMPRKDLNSQHSSASLKSPSNTVTKPVTTNSNNSLYESMESLNSSNESSVVEKETKSSGKYDLPPSQSCKASDSEIESVKSFKLETPCAIEILMGRFVILESSYFSTIKRHCFEQELEASLPLLAAVERFMGISAGRNLFNSTTRMFYCTNEDMDTETMLEMNAKEHGILTMGQLASPRGNINLVIDYTGKLVKSKRQPFTISAVNAAAEATKKNHFVN